MISRLFTVLQSRDGWDLTGQANSDVSYLLDTIIEHIPPAQISDGTLQMRISSLDYSSYQGRIAVGKISRGWLMPGSQVSLIKRDGSIMLNTVKEVYLFEGLGKEKTKQPVRPGEICAVFGMENFDIGEQFPIL